MKGALGLAGTHDLTYTRSARASTSPSSTGFCAIRDCISSSSSSPGAARRHGGSTERLGAGSSRRRAPAGREDGKAAPLGFELGLMSVGRTCPSRLLPWRHLCRHSSDRPFIAQTLRERRHPRTKIRFGTEAGGPPPKGDSPPTALVTLPREKHFQDVPRGGELGPSHFTNFFTGANHLRSRSERESGGGGYKPRT